MYTVVLIVGAMAFAGDRVGGDGVASADGRRELAGNLAGIRLDARRTLGDVLAITELSQIADAAEAVGEAATYPDGIVEVHLALETATLERRLEAALSERRSKKEEIAAVRQALRTADVEAFLTVAGFSRPEADRDARAAGGYGRNDRAEDGPALIGRQGRIPLPSVEDLLAESARLDARRKLATEAGQIRLSDGTRCMALFAARPDIESGLLREIPASAFAAPRFTTAGACEVEAGVETRVLLEIMRRQLSLDRPADDEQWDPRRLTAARDAAARIMAVGQGVRASRAVERGAGLAWAWPAPAWARQAISVTGVATSRGGAASLSEAEFDARRQIAERIDSLPWTDGRTVRQLLAGGGVTPQEMEIWLNAAHRVGPAGTEGSERVTVTVRVPLRGLYRLISKATFVATEARP